jgi:hypothetical protein
MRLRHRDRDRDDSRTDRRVRWRRRLGALAGLVTVAVGLGASGVRPAAAQTDRPAQPDEAPGRVAVVSLPTLRWEDVVEHQPPAILDLLGRSAVAHTSVRTIGPYTTLGEAYVTMGAGNRATVDNSVAGLAYPSDYPLEWGTAGEVYERRTGEPVGSSSTVQVGIASVQRSADELNYGAEPGALGSALAEAGLSTAVVANADLPGETHREAALAMMDEEGRVAGGTVAPELLSPNPAAAFGTQLDPEAVGAAALDALSDHDVVLVEASDLARVDGYWSWMTSDAADAARGRAIEAADRLVADLLTELDLSRDSIMLVGPTFPAHERPQMGVFALAGPDVEPGTARSGSTRRSGYVTLPDVAPTVLDRLGVDVPDSMTGTDVTSDGSGAPDLGDLEAMADSNDLTVFRDRAVGPASVVYIVLQVVVYALAIVALTRRRPAWLGTVAAAGALWVLAVPPLTFLSGLVAYDALGLGGYLLGLMAAAAVLAAGAWALTRRHLLGPPLALVGLTLVVLVGDIVTGGRLQINTVFGYSPVVAGRFAGYGNLAFGLLAIAAVVVATALWAMPRLTSGRAAAGSAAGAGDSPSGADTDAGDLGRAASDSVEVERGDEESRRSRMDWTWWTAAALFAVVLVVDGAPDWGADVGGVLGGVPAYGAVLLLLAGVRVGWRRLLLLGVASVAVLAVFAAVDLSRPEDQRTHLARFVESSGEGGGGTILMRKLEANQAILTSTVWAWLVPIALGFLVFLIWRDRGSLAALGRRIPGLRAFFVGGILVAVLGMAVNDSGVAVPAIMCGIALPYLTYVVISAEAAEQAQRADEVGGGDGGDEPPGSSSADDTTTAAAGSSAPDDDPVPEDVVSPGR